MLHIIEFLFLLYQLSIYNVHTYLVIVYPGRINWVSTDQNGMSNRLSSVLDEIKTSEMSFAIENSYIVK